MKKLLIALGLVLLAAGAVQADNEFWSSVVIQYPYNDRTKLQAIPEIRIRDNLSDLYYLRIYLGPSMALSKNFGLNLYYAPNYVKANNSWTALGYLDVTDKWVLPWFEIGFNNRERLEYDFTPRVLKVRSLFRFSRDGWFVDDELFYNANGGFFDEGRSQAGFGAKLGPAIEYSVSYLLRRQKSNPGDDWRKTSAINLGVKI